MKKKGLFIIIVVVLLIAFGVSAFKVGSYLLEGKKSQDRYNELSQMKENTQSTTAAPTTTAATAATDSPTEPTATTAATEPEILSDYKNLYEMNSDLVGWIKIDGTKVDYPVMQTPDDPDFYLYRDFDKANSTRGAIYVREVCDVNKPSDNVTIYGHHMADGSMFAGLNAYVNKSAWENNSLILFDTLTEYHVYEIFAVFATSANLGEGFSYHQFVDAETEEEFDEFVATCKQLAYYDTGITPKYGDKLICLSTCEYTHGDNGRLVVAAYRIT